MDAEGGRGEEMTLAIGLSAVERLAHPESAVGDARRWSTHVGVIGDDSPEDVTSAMEQSGADPDFVSGEGGTVGALAAIRQRFPTDRHVFVGVNDTDRQTAQALGWEYLSIETAAEKADWNLADDSEDSKGDASG